MHHIDSRHNYWCLITQMIREPFNISSDLSPALSGFWLGLLIAVFLLAIFFVVAIFKLNWKKMTEEVGISDLLKLNLSSNYAAHDHVINC